MRNLYTTLIFFLVVLSFSLFAVGQASSSAQAPPEQATAEVQQPAQQPATPGEVAEPSSAEQTDGNEPTEPQTDGGSLPATASTLPLLAMIGGLALGGAALLRFLLRVAK